MNIPSLLLHTLAQLRRFKFGSQDGNLALDHRHSHTKMTFHLITSLTLVSLFLVTVFCEQTHCATASICTIPLLNYMPSLMGGFRDPQVPLDVEGYPVAPRGLELEQVHVYVRHGQNTISLQIHVSYIFHRRTRTRLQPNAPPTS